MKKELTERDPVAVLMRAKYHAGTETRIMWMEKGPVDPRVWAAIPEVQANEAAGKIFEEAIAHVKFDRGEWDPIKLVDHALQYLKSMSNQGWYGYFGDYDEKPRRTAYRILNKALAELRAEQQSRLTGSITGK